MYTAQRTIDRRGGFTLVELIVVIGIILVIAALGAAFAPSVADSQNTTRAVDQLEQWLLTAKMRAKRDGLATGIRFTGLDATTGWCSEFQYIQQPDSLSGGICVGQVQPAPAYQYPPNTGGYYTGGLCISAANGVVTFVGVDFTAGIALGNPYLYLVQPGDYFELRDGGAYYIQQVIVNNGVGNQLQLLPTSTYAAALSISSPTTNYRILRQPRILIGEPPLQLPNNMVVDTSVNTSIQASASGNIDILFSPSGAILGANASSGKIYLYVHDSTQIPVDPDRAGIVAVQCRTGFIGAYDVAPGADPFLYAEEGRASGL